ncbi:orphan [Acanthamoeba polyphaga mimivirus]|nr:orphan [Acanthamoeba polyphaga mimivirus]
MNNLLIISDLNFLYHNTQFDSRQIESRTLIKSDYEPRKSFCSRFFFGLMSSRTNRWLIHK